MTIPETCPHCGARYHKDGRFACWAELIGGTMHATSLCRINAKAKAVIAKPNKTTIALLNEAVL